MGRTTTFYEFTKTTKRKWYFIAKKAATLAYQYSEGDKNRVWLKDEIIEHIREVMTDEGKEIDERRAGMYLERVRMASIFGSIEDLEGGSSTIYPLDLVSTENGMGYKWIRDGKIPAGFLSHILSIANAVPRIAFDYFMFLSHERSLEELVDAIKPTKAMTLLLLAELYIRVHHADKFTVKQIEDYLSMMAMFKSEVQSKITVAEAEGFNAMASGLLLSPPNN